MPHVSVTRLRLRKWRFLLGFAWHTWRSARQARRADGFIGGYIAGTGRLAYWTVTAWDNADAMRAYRNAGDHGRAMRALQHWCDEASVAGAEAGGLLGTNEATELMASEGRLSKVRCPSPAHAAGRIEIGDGPLRRAMTIARL